MNNVSVNISFTLQEMYIKRKAFLERTVAFIVFLENIGL